MSQLTIFLLAVALVFVALVFLARRALARRHWALRVAGGIGLLVLSAVLVTFVESERVRRVRYDPPQQPLVIPDDSASLARGAHLVTVLGCPSCHGENLGGKVLFDQPGVATLIAPNLTTGPGGRGGEYSDAELARTLRYGIRRNGQALFAMPTPEFHSLADQDLAAVIARVRRMPPVASTLPETHIGVLGRIGIATGKYRPTRELLPRAAPRPQVPPSGVMVEHGRYLAHAICAECHGSESGVAPVPAGQPPRMDVLGGYELPALVRALREGIAQDGRRLGPLMRPDRVGQLTDEEVAALQLYFRSRLAGRA